MYLVADIAIGGERAGHVDVALIREGLRASWLTASAYRGGSRSMAVASPRRFRDPASLCDGYILRRRLLRCDHAAARGRRYRPGAAGFSCFSTRAISVVIRLL